MATMALQQSVFYRKIGHWRYQVVSYEGEILGEYISLNRTPRLALKDAIKEFGRDDVKIVYTEYFVERIMVDAEKLYRMAEKVDLLETKNFN